AVRRLPLRAALGFPVRGRLPRLRRAPMSADFNLTSEDAHKTVNELIADRNKWRTLYGQAFNEIGTLKAERDRLAEQGEQIAEAASNALDQMRRERDQLAEALRIREQSQIPVIPRAAQERLEQAEAERDEAKRNEAGAREGAHVSSEG